MDAAAPDPAGMADAAERARFGGIGLTRREAIRELREGFAYTDEMLATLNEPFGRDGYSRLMIALSGLGEHDADGPASRGLEVRALIAAGADVTATSSKGRTALHFAASNGRPDAVRMLLAAGARPNAPAADGPLGVTPLSWAARCAADERARQRLKAPGASEAARGDGRRARRPRSRCGIETTCSGERRARRSGASRPCASSSARAPTRTRGGRGMRAARAARRDRARASTTRSPTSCAPTAASSRSARTRRRR